MSASAKRISEGTGGLSSIVRRRAAAMKRAKAMGKVMTGASQFFKEGGL